MRKTFKILTLLLTLGVVWYLFQDIVINAVSARPCKNPISYSLVAFDERFGISRDYFINALKEAESIWEKPIEKDLFVYQENSNRNSLQENIEKRQNTIKEEERKMIIEGRLNEMKSQYKI